MLNELAFIGVVLAGLYFLALAAVSMIAPAKARGFLLGFAASATTHYVELALRIAVGAAFVVRAPLMTYSVAFGLFGWVLIITGACLLLLPWRWHQRFARRAVPQALKGLGWIGIGALILGGIVLICAVRGRFA